MRLIRTWPVRGALAGTAGTTAMTLGYAAIRTLRGGARTPLDYDDSLVPGEIVAKLLRLRNPGQAVEKDLGEGLRWSYGPAFGLLHVGLRSKLDEPLASAIFGATLMSATLSLFPLLGHTPPPWRWGPKALATSVVTHVAYVATAAVVDDRLSTPPPPRPALSDAEV
jgi:hypothetical protein